MRRLILINVKHKTSIFILFIAKVIIFTFLLGGCVGPPALHDSVIGYDKTTNKLEQELLLLNIARTHHLYNVHFTITGSIAATFDFASTAGITRQWRLNDKGDFYNLNLGASARENPTFQIVPISGQEFTKRLVSPLPEGAYSVLVFQGTSIPLVTRLMASGLRIQDRNGFFQRYIGNDPLKPEEYKQFRRFTIHLAGLWNTQKLFVRNLLFDEVVIEGLIVQPRAEDLWKAEGLKWWLNPDGTWKVTRRKIGRTLISNYDPFRLSHSERYQLNEIAQNNADNYVMVDIRPGYPGGDLPFFGAFKLRSYFGILSFIGKGIDRAVEFDVAKNPRTPDPIGANPRQTLAIKVTEQSPGGGRTYVRYKGKYYSAAGSAWDREAFRILGLLFQVTVTDVSDVGIPITIAK